MTRVAIAGLGTIGTKLAQALASGAIPNMRVSAVSSRDTAKARATLTALGLDVPVVSLH
jgi:aspartate dehydrogenase